MKMFQLSESMAGRTHLVLREEDVVKLVCEFLENRAMTISQISLERESGVINGDLSDDIVFLRKIFSKIKNNRGTIIKKIG